MKNKRVKQMIADIILQGRKAVWYGEETEIFAALNEQHCEDEFKEGYFPKTEKYDYCGIASSDWKYWWQPCAYEFDYKTERMSGGVVKNSHGDILPYYQSLPLLCGVYGNSDDVVQVSTSYN